MADLRMMVFGMPPFNPGSPSATYTNFTVDASGERVAVGTFQAEEDATITHLGFRYGVRTGTPPTYRVSLQALDGSGNPDGTVLGGGSPASATFTPPADATWDGTWRKIALDNSIAVTRGGFYAIVVDYSSGTIDASNCSSFTQAIGSGSSSPVQALFPHAQTYNGSAWSKLFGMPVFGYYSSTRTYGFPVETGISQGVTQTGSPDEIGIKFTYAAEIGATFKIIGAYGTFRLNGLTGTLSLKLYDSDGSTVLQSISIDSAYASGIGGGSYAMYLFDESTLSTLNFGSTYYLTVEATSATSIFLYGMTVDTTDEDDAYGMPGAVSYVSRTDAGSWTEDANSRLTIYPILTDITEPSSSGGYIF